MLFQKFLYGCRNFLLRNLEQRFLEFQPFIFFKLDGRFDIQGDRKSERLILRNLINFRVIDFGRPWISNRPSSLKNIKG